ncbi:putative porin [Pseudohalioglobus sediminis]|nr:putative porin [Pseudohalioglobus sediminis]
MKDLLRAAVAAAVVTGSASSQAAVSGAEWEQFKAQFAEMAARVEALEAENARLKQQGSSVPVDDLSKLQADVAVLQSQNSAAAWSEKIKIGGDFRYRYEYIDVEDRDSRERNRIRARMAVTAKLPSDTEVGLGVATGGDDPVSTNQTLGGGGSTKDLRLDKAYFRWNATEEFHLQAGKFSNPLYKPQKSSLLWDGDWRPEGVSAGWAGNHLFANFLGNWLESDTRGNNDEFAWGLQGGTRFNLGEASLTTAVAYYDFPTAGARPFYGDDDEPEFFGNSFTDDDRYLYNYEMIEIGGDLSMNLFEMPLSIYANFVQNQDADDYDTGWLAGATLGKAKGKGTWAVGYQYRDLEADAVLGLLSDSDFAGGGTDGKGHVITGAYGINKQWSLGFTWFVNNEAGEKNLAEEGGALDYDRIQIDTKFKY